MLHSRFGGDPLSGSEFSLGSLVRRSAVVSPIMAAVASDAVALDVGIESRRGRPPSSVSRQFQMRCPQGILR
jgi:hypothetical protein